MNLKNQVVSFELAKKLKELGVVQNSMWCWTTQLDWDDKGHNYRKRILMLADEFHAYDRGIDWCSAYTVAELGVMLPEDEHSWRWGKKWRCTGSLIEEVKETMYDKEADARAAMLIWLIENTFLDVEQLNQRLEAA